MLIQRRLSREGVSPYAEVSWEERDVRIEGSDGNVVFEQKKTLFPATWSETASKVVASKYFRGRLGTTGRETSAKDLIERVVSTLTRWGVEDGYFNEAQSWVFRDELTSAILNQYGTFNSPVWFNVGVPGNDKPQCSACFILKVEDDMKSILNWISEEGMVFKGGSGAGVNVSSIRSSVEPLSGGGKASGPIPFMKAADTSAGSIKSGGKCLVGSQKIFTASGPRTAKELAESGSRFVTLSYDPPAERFKAKWAECWKSGQKRTITVVTDKGEFDVSFDHPFRLSDGRVATAEELKVGTSLMSCSVVKGGDGRYPNVCLKNGRKGKELLHRLVARDILGWEIDDLSIHHLDDNPQNCDPSNLQRMTQSDHARFHNQKVVSEGRHAFQVNKFDTAGSKNGMHRDGVFWKSDKASDYRRKQGETTRRIGKTREMQDLAATSRMLNYGYKLINDGHDISTIDGYYEARKGKLACTKTQLLWTVEARFGSYDNFVKELAANNHRVIGLIETGVQDVYSVEVDCPTKDDKSPQSGHNYVLWSDKNIMGSGVVTFNTRRAAKMVVMNVDHPDIMEFVNLKVVEEKKAQALIAAGFDSGFNVPGGAYDSVSFQNANHSVRVSDEFMRAVENDGEHQTREVVTGRPVAKLRARQLMRAIAEAAWACGDPGMQWDDTVNDWHTCLNEERINASNPCAEYVFLDQTACNLASINLMKFRSESGAFDFGLFQHVCGLFILAQEIIVDRAGYPTEKLAEMSHLYRTLGLGYANLGALLMSLGLPYDSVEGRNLAASITAIMTGEAYKTSALIAGEKGAFPRHEKNRESTIRVLEKHAAHAALLPTNALGMAARRVWIDACVLAKERGVRNAQVSVLAPTGTIAFMMDCATTGVEPELALVKYKTLVGGGTLKLVNPLVPMALKALGYSDPTIERIAKFVEERGELVGSGIAPEHLPVFDTSFPTASGRSIHHMGHIKMMEAVQPFISGAISKTVNMPQSATVEDVEEAYVESWKRGLKALAIYRDGCKQSQPLSTKKEEKVVAEEPKTSQRKMPATRSAVVHEFTIAQQKGFMTVGMFEDGTPGELFIDIAKEGSIVSGFADAFGIAVSFCLQHGVPLEKLTKKFSHMKFEPAGFTGNSDVPFAHSIPDYIFRWLEMQFGQNSTTGQPTSITVSGVDDKWISANSDKIADAIASELRKSHPGHLDAPPCPNCGSLTIRSGTCHKCGNCGTTTGCS